MVKILINYDIYQTFVKPILFRLTPEIAQSITHIVMKQHRAWLSASSLMRINNPRLAVNLSGIKLSNPIGLAAGYDKNCEYLPALSSMGFGYLVFGTITEFPNKGNPLPRIIRYDNKDAIINSLGFAGKGLDYAISQLEHSQHLLCDTPVVASVSGITIEEIIRCLRRVEPLVSAVEINISSPNTLGLRVFHQPDKMKQLIRSVNENRQKPVFIKLPPYKENSLLNNEQKDMVLNLVKICLDYNMDAITVANTYPARDSRLSVGAGGLSGKPIFTDMIHMVKDIKHEVGDRITINACGGVFSGEDAIAAIMAGANSVQLLTSLIYKGPYIVKHINEEILNIMNNRNRNFTIKELLS